MQPKINLILTAPTDQLRQAQRYHLPIAHLAYRMGGGPHLFRVNQQPPLRGGLMVIDDRGYDGRGEGGSFCREVMQECTARQFTGVFCDFESRYLTQLTKLIGQLAPMCQRRGLPLYVPEHFGPSAPTANVLISSALSGGSLTQRLEGAIAQFGVQRISLAVERVSMDFFLPSPTGQGVPLSREELAQQLEQRSPSVFFSRELCAHYFTYMSRLSGAHFILFDDAASIRKKLETAAALGIPTAVLAYPEVDDLLEQLLA